MNNSNVNAFFELVRAGIWGKECRLSQYKDIDFAEIYRITEEQSVTGLVTAGLERARDVKIPQEWTLQFVGATLQLEQRNKDMNGFLVKLFTILSNEGVYALLVKGQGVAQCFERPLWRACGDVDLFLSNENYVKVKNVLIPMSTSVEKEVEYDKHLGLTIDGWLVELHGNLRGGLSSKIDRELDDIVNDTFYSGNVRSWMYEQVHIFQMGIENDVVFVFTHFLKHFFKEGLGLRQICDWCRLLWTYRYKIDSGKLEHRIKKMGLISEWRAFGAYAVKYLGMPEEAVPMFSTKITVHDSSLRKKVDLINKYILSVGNMGHNLDMSYYSKYPYLVRKGISMERRIGNLLGHARLFPLDSMRFMFKILAVGFNSAAKGE